MTHACCDHTFANGIYNFDARGVAKRFRHAAIFGAMDSLKPGETMRFCNDHDPIPLIAQMLSRFEGRIVANYVSREHEKVVIDFKLAA